MNIEQLATGAVASLLQQRPYEMEAPAERPRNFPLPIKKNDGGIQQYRPLAILEYCNDVLSGRVAAAEARERAKQAKDPA